MDSLSPAPALPGRARTLAISTVDLYLTGTCNFACRYCYGEDDRAPHMTRAVFDRCLAFAEHVGASTLEFCGGEPLLSPSFAAFTALARERGFRLILRTNGIFLERHLDLVAANFDWVGVSIDGMPEANARMRPSRTRLTPAAQFEIPFANVRRLKEANPGVKILLASVASAQNWTDLVPLYEYVRAQAIPVDRWKIYQFIRDKFRSEANHEDFSLAPEAFARLAADLRARHDGRFELLLQRADQEGAGGNCLLVYHDGTVKILEHDYGRIGVDAAADIAERLFASPAAGHIRQNKHLTYQAAR